MSISFRFRLRLASARWWRAGLARGQERNFVVFFFFFVFFLVLVFFFFGEIFLFFFFWCLFFFFFFFLGGGGGGGGLFFFWVFVGGGFFFVVFGFLGFLSSTGRGALLTRSSVNRKNRHATFFAAVAIPSLLPIFSASTT